MRKTWVLGGAALLAAWAVPTGVATAGKSPPAPVPPGTIFIGQSGAPGTVVANGNGVVQGYLTALTSNIHVQNRMYGASRMLHGGKRWFLFNEGMNEPGFLNHLGVRWELHAVREDGVNVRLTSDPTMDFDLYPVWVWSPDENGAGVTIAGFGRRWTGNTASDTVVPGSVGLYRAHLAFDAAGNVTGLTAPPALFLDVGTLGAYPRRDASSFSWSPDMTKVVVGRQTDGSAQVFDVATGAATTILHAGTNAGGLVWSPDGARIAFFDAAWTLRTITPDGANDRVLASAAPAKPGRYLWSMVGQFWSPDSAYLAYTIQSFDPVVYDQRRWVSRVAATGGTPVKISPEYSTAIDWR